MIVPHWSCRSCSSQNQHYAATKLAVSVLVWMTEPSAKVGVCKHSCELRSCCWWWPLKLVHAWSVHLPDDVAIAITATHSLYCRCSSGTLSYYFSLLESQLVICFMRKKCSSNNRKRMHFSRANPLQDPHLSVFLWLNYQPIVLCVCVLFYAFALSLKEKFALNARRSEL